MNLKGTQTEMNIIKAFAGEAQARAKYTYYAIEAREEGKEDIALLFEKMAANEREHAKIWYKIVHGGFGDTETNLKRAAQGENTEWKNMYPEFAAVARSEGYEALAILFERVAAIENDHERQFMEALLKLQQNVNGQMDKDLPILEPQKEKNIEYTCMFCGHNSPTELEKCPVCGAENAFTL